MDNDFIDVDFYDAMIKKENFEKAFEYYKNYMNKENLEMEVSEDYYEETGFINLSQSELSHILYHAEINGFNISEHLE